MHKFLRVGSGKEMKRYINLLNIFLALVIASQLRVWLSGPFSGYLFTQTFIGLAILCLGAYGIFRWNKYGVIKKIFVIALICASVAILFEYEPVVSYLLR